MRKSKKNPDTPPTVDRSSTAAKPPERADDDDYSWLPPRELVDAVTAAEIVEWFHEAGSKTRPVPDEAAVEILVAEVNEIIWLMKVRQHLPNSGEHLEVGRHLNIASTSATKTYRELTAAMNAFNAIPRSHASEFPTEFNPLLLALEKFLFVFPPRPVGRRPRGEWTRFACKWAVMVARGLIALGWQSASTTRDNAVVPFVVAKMLHAALGENIHPDTVSRYLRSATGRRELEAISAT